MQLTIDEIVSTLNKWMNDDVWEYYTRILNCKREELVPRFGFGHKDDRIYTLTNYWAIEVRTPIKRISTIIEKAKLGDKDDKIEAIETILEESE